MDLGAAVAEWDTHGFVVLPGFVGTDALAPALAELHDLFPTADEFHDNTTPERNKRFIGDEFAGIDGFPFAGVELSLLAVCDQLIDLAEAFLGTSDLRVTNGEVWAKYTGADDYEQALHRDYLSHTLLVPTDAPEFRHLEMFLFLCDVPEELGPPHYVSKTVTADMPATPNWIPKSDVTVPAEDRGVVGGRGRPDLYRAEASAAGPAGTVVAYELGTFHRGTALRAPRGARYTIHVNFRPAGVDWNQKVGWASKANGPSWYRFVERATPRQLQLFGFPAPGHPYWTDRTLRGMAERYAGFDAAAWRPAR